MGAGYRMKCNNCDFSVVTSGPWEFFRDEKGKPHDFGHPSPVSDEAGNGVFTGFMENFTALHVTKSFR